MYATPYDKHFYDFLTDNSGKVCNKTVTHIQQ